jgi:hypothetical protein
VVVYTTVNSVLGRLRQEDCKFEASMGYIVRPEKKKKEKKKKEGRKGLMVYRHLINLFFSIYIFIYFCGTVV